MAILAIDYGKKRIGLAIAFGDLAEPLAILENRPGFLKSLKKLCQAKRVKKIILGLPEGKEGKNVKNFKRELEKSIDIPVVFWDETFTSQKAQKQALESGKKKKSRKSLDSFAAAIILQEYLDSRVSML